MARREQPNVSADAATTLDNIDDVLAWEPGDPLLEQEYDVDFVGAGSYIETARCKDCDVSWPENDVPCWSCGKEVPPLNEWWKDHASIPQGQQMRSDHSTGAVQDLIWVPNSVYRSNPRQPLYLSAVMFEWVRRFMIDPEGLDYSQEQASVYMQNYAVWDAQMVWTMNSMSSRRGGRSAAQRYWLDEWTTSDNTPEMKTYWVDQAQVDIVPKTPAVFDFDLGLPKPQPTSFRNTWVNPWLSPTTHQIRIPRVLPKAEIPLPVMTPQPIDTQTERLLFDLSFPTSAPITQVRRSRHI